MNTLFGWKETFSMHYLQSTPQATNVLKIKENIHCGDKQSKIRH